MSEYTPSMDRLKGSWVDQCAGMDPEMRGNEEWIRAQQATFDRAIAAHDAELREQIAREIEVHMRRHDNAQIGFSAVGDAYAHAASITRGKTGEVKRCLQCGCDLRYPTVAHIVDCGTRKEQD